MCTSTLRHWPLLANTYDSNCGKKFLLYYLHIQWLEGRKIITTTLKYKGELIVCKMYCVTIYIFLI